VVHGGSYFAEAAPANDDTLRKIEACIPLAPLHNPVELLGIRECMALHGEVPHFVSFDTAFHQNKPELTSTFPIPKQLREAYGYRKFGFHGASHRYVAQRAAALMGRKLEELKLVTCHLGGGSSITAVKGGIAWDTTATFGTCTGMPMGTRSGDIDLGVVLDLLTSKGKTAEEVSGLLYTESGLLALSGVSADMAELERLEAQGHGGARLARDYYAYSLKRFIGSFAAAMDGLDGIVFTAGIGENDGALREKVCRELAWMGVRFDGKKNELRGVETFISSAGSPVAVLVIPTNEELAIALEVAELLDRGGTAIQHG
jgi:acetate kinase